MAQAEINPDHFDDNPPQAPAIHMAAQNAAPNSVTHPSHSASEMHAHSNGRVAAGKSSAHQGSATETNAVSSPDLVTHATTQKRHKKLISEARHHGMP
jgi:hypothetical protein